ncbi:MAG: cytochrome c class [Gemmatimonadetes bacterium]|nr:cytochrome c class [Gemmatimonadota bacterium]
MTRRILIWLGYALGGAAALLVVAAIAVYVISERRAHKQYTIALKPFIIPSDSTTIARGAHLATAIGKCVQCHGEQLEGSVMFDDPALGRVAARNLTRGTGGVGRILTDADLLRAIRHAVGPDGRPLLIMPSQNFIELTDDDLAAVVAYVKSVPPVDNLLPESRLGPLGRALLVAGKLPFFPAELLDHTRASPTPIAEGGTAEYGGYLARVGCVACHGPTLAGGPIAAGDPNWPPAANLTVAGPTKSWTEENFKTLLRTGTRPDSTPVNLAMPWKTAGRMTDEEIHAVWLYLRSIPGQPTGGTIRTAAR